LANFVQLSAQIRDRPAQLIIGLSRCVLARSATAEKHGRGRSGRNEKWRSSYFHRNSSDALSGSNQRYEPGD
jgi:hypothetical protein